MTVVVAGWLVLCSVAAFGAREIGRFDFAAPAAVVADRSGFGNTGKLVGGLAGGPGPGEPGAGERGALACDGKAYVELPAGEAIWGPQAARGAVCVWVRPSFAPQDLSSGLWEGYATIFYVMKTHGNGLPDGPNEIGLWCHGPNLYAKYAATSFGPTFALPSPLRKGRWTHLAFCWGPKLKALYVDGRCVERDEGANEPVSLDAFPAMIGQHCSSRRWAWPGSLADCRLYDDALPGEEVGALARARPPGGPPGPTAPAVARADWGEVWMGDRKVAVTLGALPPGAEAEVSCEVLGPQGREEFPAVRAVGGVASAPYGLRREGWSRVNVLVRVTGRVVGGRSAFADVPPLSPMLEEIQARLQGTEAALQGPGVPEAARAALRPQYQALQAEQGALRGKAMALPSRAEWEGLRSEAATAAGRAQRMETRALIYARGSRDGVLPEFGLGVDHSLRKILKQDPFAGKLEAPVELKAARGEYQAAQVFVFGLDKDLEGVSVVPSDLAGPQGALIPRADVTWNQVGYVKTLPPTYEVRYVGLWPDPLLPPAAFKVQKGSFEIIWLTVRVPREAAAGEYTGTVTVSAANVAPRALPVRLRVWDFALPERSSLTTAFGLNCMGAFAGSMDVDRWVRNAYEHRISLGFPGAVLTGAVPVYPSFDFSGQTLSFRVRAEAEAGVQVGPLFLVLHTEGKGGDRVFGPLPLKRQETSDLRVALAAEEKPTAVRLEYRSCGPVKLHLSPLKVGDEVWDALNQPQWWQVRGPWAKLSREAEGLCFEVGAPAPGEAMISEWPRLERQAINTPAQVPFRLDFTDFDRRVEKYLERGVNALYIPVPGCPSKISEADARRLVQDNFLGPISRAYQDHLKQKGWLKYAYTYVADEPEGEDYPGLNVVQGTIKQWAPELPNMLTARSFPPELKYVDIWCPEVYSFEPKAAAREQARGKRVWWYPAFSTRHPFPDFWVDYPALDCRIIFWLTWKHHLDGLLYWSISAYQVNEKSPPSPWDHAMTFPGANGDGVLVYPGRDGGPVNSIRWECIRDGAQDYEYFVLLKAALARVEARGAQALAEPRARALAERARGLLAIDDGVVRNWREWTDDPARLLAARDEMGQVIEALQEVAR